MKTTGAGSKKESLAAFKKRVTRIAGPDSPIYREGLTMTSVRTLKPSATTSPTPTVGTKKERRKPTPGHPVYTGNTTGIVSFHKGDLDSRPDSPATMSFGYFRTKSGLPPSVDKAKESKD